MSLPFPPLDGETAASTPRATVRLHALPAGHFSLPEEQFVYPATPAARRTVPSLCFLIQHVCTRTGATTRIVFDLGLRRDVERYSEPIRRHVATRQPMSTDPDVVKSLKAGGLTPDDIHYVIYSHVRYPLHNPLSFVVDFLFQGPFGPCRRASRLCPQHLCPRPRISRCASWQLYRPTRWSLVLRSRPPRPFSNHRAPRPRQPRGEQQ